jgi:uncharacterized protein (TIGR02466 family)|tara:strand:+ start:55 stop:657 length:603 start_codon:yes stop_codon:yes gene_type:complete
MNNLIPLFPTAIQQVDLGPPDEDELNYIKKLEKVPNQGNKTSKDNYILNRPQLSNIARKIEAQVLFYLREIQKAQDSVTLNITQSWCNYSEPNEWHHKHKHPNSILSGVYYPQATEELDCIHFFNPIEPMIKVITTEDTPFNSGGESVPVKTGMLYLFPSFIEHAVPMLQQRNSTRISLSFNTFYRGELGCLENLNRLKV